MSNARHLANLNSEPGRRSRRSRHFPVYAGRFDDLASRDTIDALSNWVERRYAEDLRRRPSKHVYVRTLPLAVIEQIDRLRDNAAIRSAIPEHFDGDCLISPMKHTDELHISHHNMDYGGDHVLHGGHYDGNLRFLPSARWSAR